MQTTTPQWQKYINRTVYTGLGGQLLQRVTNNYDDLASHGDIGSFPKRNIFPTTVFVNMFEPEACPCHCVKCWFSPPPPRPMDAACASAPPTASLLRSLKRGSSRWDLLAALGAEYWLRPTARVLDAALHIAHEAGLTRRPAHGDHGSRPARGGAGSDGAADEPHARWGASMGIHVRRGERLHDPKGITRLIQWTPAQAAEVVRTRHAPPHCPADGRARAWWCGAPVLVSSDDADFALELRRLSRSVSSGRIQGHSAVHRIRLRSSWALPPCAIYRW